MSAEHLSSLQLDEVAAGLVARPAHLESCETCTSRLAKLTALNAAFLLRPEAVQLRERLSPPAATPTRRSLVLVSLSAVLSAAAALVLFTWAPEPVTERVKGAPTVSLLDGQGHSVHEAKPGQHLTLELAAPGFERASAFTISPSGQREPLWSGPLVAPRVNVLELDVTPGDVEVLVEFTGPHGTATASTKLRVP